MPNKRGAEREALVSAVIDALPDWANAVIQLNDLIAERMGVVPTDFQCLHLLHRDGPTTASVLATRIGLTPGSVSRMIDRLDAAGCVRRSVDPVDRRRVLIEPTAAGLRRIAAYYADLTSRTRDDLADFDEDQLRALLRFFASAQRSTTGEVTRLRARSKP
ncbi:MarR family winged helix-turn-helix transcriptional regulator [Goodfellowiella coeruleoviolacea]|uniref:DNA-binding transcriptional regulator, MarR family n=1 Tax=Goodfellowiella coeruleoviolacea TaxID=334858 RepID=A0AAE3GJ17_9PSEU|nr:MarR family winged helix-turn-helix transcriptional regulator [Goodfellowiella coeruleoviolacea]MCP2169106.1 DNA-binding transcriptional regulator, MarR family [Goodfellowiella coeruleoviolacea]